MLYRKKPVEVEAYKVAELLENANSNWAALPDCVKASYEMGDIMFFDHTLNVMTLEGVMTANEEDYLIKGVEGELYPCKPSIFEASYDKVMNKG